jgi:hypothetical protein
MVMVAVVGEYVGRIYHEVKRRPHYVLQEDHPPAAGPGTPEPLARAAEAGR